MTVYIYTLSDPDTSTVMYVGQTIEPSKRFSQHMNPGKEKYKKEKWVRSLINQGKKPVMTVIDECEPDKANEVEQSWIYCHTLLRRQVLLNETDSWFGGQYYAKVRRHIYDNWSVVKPNEQAKCYICKGEIIPETARLDFNATNDESWQCGECYEKYGINPYLIELWYD